jgi:hypothetical protein
MRRAACAQNLTQAAVCAFVVHSGFASFASLREISFSFPMLTPWNDLRREPCAGTANPYSLD